MVLFNHATREMTAKIVYYGPGLCGKTTNLMIIFDKLDPKSRGKMLSLATKTDRTLFFDLLPVDVGKVGPFNLKIQLYTVPGQVFYNETRKLVLKGADSIVFVADSQPSMIESNRESFSNLLDNMEANQIDANDTPIVIQYNKRDIPGVLPVETLQQELGFENYPYHEASALKGEGVMETFKLVSKVTARHLINRLQGKPSKPEQEKKKAAVAVKKPAAAKPAPMAAPPPPPIAQPEPEPMMNPFADSVPFPDSPPPDARNDYEKVEEVSLEQLLEGRERPATMSGSVPIPVTFDEEVESLDTSTMVEDVAVAVAVEEAPAPPPARTPRLARSAPAPASGGAELAQLRSEIAALRVELDSIKAERDEILDTLRRVVSDLSRHIR